MPFTYYLDNKIVDLAFGGVAYSAPATVYVGLSTTTPTQSSTNVTEPSGNGYARVAVTNNTSNWPSASNGSKSNANAIIFPTSTGSWGTLTYFVIYDASTGGNLMGYGALTNSQTVSTGNTLSFAASALTITNS